MVVVVVEVVVAAAVLEARALTRLAQRLVHLQREEVGGESWGSSLCSRRVPSCTFARFASNSEGFSGFRS